MPPLTTDVSPVGASGGAVQPGAPTVTTISFDGTLTSLKSGRVLRTRAKYTPFGTPVTVNGMVPPPKLRSGPIRCTARFARPGPEPASICQPHDPAV